MAITREALPFGLRDVKIAPLLVTGLPGTLVDLPNAQEFEFTDTEEYTELRGDDRLVAKRGAGSTVEWTLNNGGISLEAYAVMAGGSVTISGTGSDTTKRYRKLATDNRPYFWVEGKAMSDSGGDFHAILPRVIADDSLEGTLSDGEFWISQASGTGLSSLSTDPKLLDVLYDFIQNEQAKDIVAFVPTP